MIRKAVGALTLLALGLGGCAAPTEVVVFVDTNLAVPCLVDTLVIRVESDGEPDERTGDATEGPLSLSIVQESNASDVTITVEAQKNGNVVASGTVDGAFDVEKTNAVHALLTSDCVAQPCRFDTTGFEVPDKATPATCDGISAQYQMTIDEGSLETILNACEIGGAIRRELGQPNDADVRVNEAELLQPLMDEFEFSFYGQRVSSVWMADDGYVAFSEEAPGATSDRVGVRSSVTVAGHPFPAVIPFWEDLAFSDAGQACAALQTTGDQQTLWLTWDSACLGPSCAAGDTLQFSVGLEERTNRVLVGFESMASTSDPGRAAGNGAVFGIVGPGPYGCAPEACGLNGLCEDGSICGFTQVFAQQQQTANWPATFVFTPTPE